MLVLTRHLNEVIRIGEKIKLKILGIESNNVKIGIEAPEDILVFRDEIYERIKNENLKASKINYDIVRNVAEKIQKKIKTEYHQLEYIGYYFSENQRNFNVLSDAFKELGVKLIALNSFDQLTNKMSDRFPDIIIMEYEYFLKIRTSMIPILKSQFIYHTKLTLIIPNRLYNKVDKQITNNIEFITEPFEFADLKRKINSILKLRS